MQAKEGNKKNENPFRIVISKIGVAFIPLAIVYAANDLVGAFVAMLRKGNLITVWN
ncbi:hypothetical protein [Halalkalibacter krulwichiae]|uniref:Uncharacterized protein n=1 Tax=Halalkalibacter krulwichiae TaxID=199441 RepID=A0A1X9MGV5_9BACI|nr:hypothetical protein [Halalkalibacter krulwichiae]ARK32668.1 hypothetical protein BkAM31D_23995 [Halalkalibacter krulwichiae]